MRLEKLAYSFICVWNRQCEVEFSIQGHVLRAVENLLGVRWMLCCVRVYFRFSRAKYGVGCKNWSKYLQMSITCLLFQIKMSLSRFSDTFTVYSNQYFVCWSRCHTENRVKLICSVKYNNTQEKITAPYIKKHKQDCLSYKRNFNNTFLILLVMHTCVHLVNITWHCKDLIVLLGCN